jgi:hypothetical protein
MPPTSHPLKWQFTVSDKGFGNKSGAHLENGWLTSQFTKCQHDEVYA